MNTVQIAAKLYDARDTMRLFWGDHYLAKVNEWKHYIEQAAVKWQCSEMDALMRLVKLLQEKDPASGMTQALLLAAYVEMVEPSK